MKIVVFGATGSTGSQVVEQGLASGHEMIAVARTPGRISARRGLSARLADVHDPSSTRTACIGADVVVSCIGPSSNRTPGNVVSEGTRNILAGCAVAGVGRFIMQSGITCSDGAELSWPSRLMLSLVRPLFADAIADKATAERAVQASALEWVILRPVGLANGVARAAHVAGPRVRVSPFLPLPFANCAQSVIRAATEGGWTRQIINVGR